MRIPRIIVALASALPGLLAGGCAVLNGAAGGEGGRIEAILFFDGLRPRPMDGAPLLRAARNETASFSVRINDFASLAARKPSIRMLPLKSDASEESIPAEAFSVYEIVAMPVEAGRADFVRHTGLEISRHRLPRALAPLSGEAGVFSLDALREREGPMLWVECAAPPTLPPGEYASECQLLAGKRLIATLSVRLHVHDFVIPDERNLVLTGQAGWERLRRHYPAIIGDLSPRLLNRDKPEHAAAVRLLDELVQLAHVHRVSLSVPDVQPTVKWPSGRPVQVDWSDFDSVVRPWLTGSAFADTVPVGFWPLPAIDGIERLGMSSRCEYWAEAAAHFDGLGWLERSAMIWPRPDRRPGLSESVQMSEDAARVLSSHPRIRVSLPLEEEQVQLADARSPQRITPGAIPRLHYLAPGLVSRPSIQALPEGQGRRYLEGADRGSLQAGAGVDEREARQWAFLAFVRGVTMIHWRDVLPKQADVSVPGDPAELVWFYPGEWFGVDRPVPTLQLKWLRQAQIDYEYLQLARQRGQGARAELLARLLTRPIELQTLQDADALYGLFSGTSDERAWERGLELLARTVAVAPPGQSIDAEKERQLAIDVATWLNEQRRPLMLARSTDWSMGVIDNQGQSWLNLQLGVDIYNPAEQPPDSNALLWQQTPEAWTVRPEGCLVPKMRTSTINSYELPAAINGSKLTAASRAPVRIALVEGHSGKAWPLDVVTPVGVSEERIGRAPSLDDHADLRDWSSEDALHTGPLVRMLDRPSLQRQEPGFTQAASAIYSTWTQTTLYLAFKVEGASVAISNAESSFVRYDGRRAWGEDVCEVLIQPIYADNTVGPLLHVAVKPRGQLEVSRRLDPKRHANPWQGFSGADIRYSANIQGPTWRGEIAIPWDAINAQELRGKRPAALRFNFAQHFGATGQSASWAGPVDYGRDERFTGLLEIRTQR